MPFCHIVLKGRRPISKDYPKELKTLGDHLRKRRLDLGLLQKEVAQKLDVDETSIYNWEKSRSSPRLYLIPEIVKFLGYMPDQPANANFGLRIHLARRSLGIRQDFLARQLGVDPSTIGRWEQGKGQPQARNMKKVTEFLKTTPLDGQM